MKRRPRGRQARAAIAPFRSELLRRDKHNSKENVMGVENRNMEKRKKKKNNKSKQQATSKGQNASMVDKPTLSPPRHLTPVH